MPWQIAEINRPVGDNKLKQFSCVDNRSGSSRNLPVNVYIAVQEWVAVMLLTTTHFDLSSSNQTRPSTVMTEATGKSFSTQRKLGHKERYDPI